MTSDIFLGWERVEGVDGERRDFYVRQLRDGKGSVVVERMDPATLAFYGRLCGKTLARAHARSGDRMAIAGYLGGSTVFDTAIADYSMAYAEQNNRDHASLRRAADEGRVRVREGI
jgi:thiamine monophosphate kinase